MKELLKGNLVGVANGRAVYGPRAVGIRCLLADPRGKDIKDKMNEIKNRQEFRPFAPSVLEEYTSEYFDIDRPSPYMLLVADVKKNIQISMSEKDQIKYAIQVVGARIVMVESMELATFARSLKE